MVLAINIKGESFIFNTHKAPTQPHLRHIKEGGHSINELIITILIKEFLCTPVVETRIDVMINMRSLVNKGRKPNGRIRWRQVLKKR